MAENKKNTSDFGVLESDDNILSTLRKDGKRIWLYPTLSKGKHYYRRMGVAWGLIALFISLPLIEIGGHPAILLDFIHRKFAILGLVFYPTDTILLMVFMITMLLIVILGTSLLGRIWCGWGCPQTVYMEFLFRPIERLIEGKENKRKRRDEGKWNFDKTWRKSLKFIVYLGISFLLANVFISYFVGWDNLAGWMISPPTAHWGFFLIMAVTTGAILFDFGYFREQMCTIACPYARMQSVLLDQDSMIVSYDPNRGEDRAKRSKKVMAKEAAGEIEAKGDCIDCFACVRTCPTGIDIRDGLQMECITCTQCIDACDDIMTKIDKPKGLIRYTSENALAGKNIKLLRPRTLIYSTLIVAIAIAFGVILSSRGSYDVDLARSVGDPFIEQGENILNRLRFRVRNQTGSTNTFTVKAIQPAGAIVTIAGPPTTSLDPGEMKRIEFFVTAPKEAFTNSRADATFELVFEDGYTEQHEYLLLGPTE